MASSKTKDSCLQSRTILWCVPRTISTAITKCLTDIEDSEIWFEPYFYAEVFETFWNISQKTQLPLDYKGNEDSYKKVIDIATTQTAFHFKMDHVSYASLKRYLESGSSSHVFVKDMAFTTNVPYSSLFPEGYKHTFLIRHPLRAMYSYRKSLYKFLLKSGMLRGSAAEEKTFDIERDNPFYSCFNEKQYVMWNYVRENIDSHPIVMDSDDFLAKPAEMLSKYCRAIGLPYADSLLKWNASDDSVKSWKIPADDLFEYTGHFYDTALGSCEFFAASEMPSRDHVTPDVIRYTDRVIKYYEEMYASRIRLGNDD